MAAALRKRVKEGYLKKLPPLSGNPTRKKFKKRWVVLWESCHLAYYGKKDGHSIKEIDLQSSTDVQPNFRIPGVIRDAEFAFIVKTPPRDWVFLAENENEMNSWVYAIRRFTPGNVAMREKLPLPYQRSISFPLIRSPQQELKLRNRISSPHGISSFSKTDATIPYEYQELFSKPANRAAAGNTQFLSEDLETREATHPISSIPFYVSSQIVPSNENSQKSQTEDNYVLFHGSLEKDLKQTGSRSNEDLVSCSQDNQEYTEVRKKSEHFERRLDKIEKINIDNADSPSDLASEVSESLSLRSPHMEQTVKSSSGYGALSILPKTLFMGYTTPVEDVIGDYPHSCITEVAELLDQTDEIGNDWRRLRSEIMKSSRRPDPDEASIFLRKEGQTLALLKEWCKIELSSAPTLGRLIELLNKIHRYDAAMIIERHFQLGVSSPDSETSPLHLIPSPSNNQELIEITFGGEKRIQLLKTSCEKHLVGVQGCLLGSLSNDWIFCIPPGALHYEQEIVTSFYHVTDSNCLDCFEFVTGIVEITPHQLTFSKSCELLLHHHLFLEGGSSEVVVLYNSGETYSKSMSSLCLLSSIDDTVCSKDMRTTLWDDVIHIETLHVCLFGSVCKGKSFIEVWASLFALERPHPDHFQVRLSITSQAPRPNDEETEMMSTYKLVRKTHQRIVLSCRHRENLTINVQILPEYEGWKVLGGTVSSQTITYNGIKDMVIHGKPVKTKDCWFTRGNSVVDVTDFAPVFEFNGDSCVLAPPEFSSKPSNLIQRDCPDRRPASLVTEKKTKSSSEPGLSMSSHTNDVVSKKSQLTTNNLDRPVQQSDIQFISGCDYITQHWKKIGWLMLSKSGYTMKSIRQDVLEHFPEDSDSVRVIHLIELWQSATKYKASAKQLVEICCHPMVGGVRHEIEMSLMGLNNGAVDGVIYGKHLHSAAAPDLESVIKVTKNVIPDQWQSVGYEMGYNNGQIVSMTEGSPNHSSKLEVIIRRKASDIGKERTAQKLLEICKRLPYPAYGEVMEKLCKVCYLKTHSNSRENMQLHGTMV